MAWKCKYCGGPNATGVKRCVYCGRTPSKAALESRGFDEALRQRRKKREAEKEGGKAKGRLSGLKQRLVIEQPTGLSGRFLKTIAAAAITAILLFASPLFPPLKNYLLELTALFVPNVADFWETGVIVVSLLLVAIAAGCAWYYNSSFAGAAVWGSILAITLIFPFISPYLELGYGSDYATSLICTLQNVGNTEGMAACQVQTSGALEDPEAKKVGDYDVLRVSLSTEYTVSKLIKVKDSGKLLFDTYFIELVVENPSDTETIKNFKIIENNLEVAGDKNTALVRSGAVKSSEKVKLAALETLGHECMDEGARPTCDIKPGEILRLTLKAIPVNCSGFEFEDECEFQYVCEWKEDEDGESGSCVSKADRKTKEVEARVKFSYDYAGEGKFDFVVANSYEALWALISNRAPKTKSDGPVDVQVSFGPTAYLLRETDTEPEVTVIIELSKEKTGEASIEAKIKITRLSDGVLTPPLSDGDVNPPSKGCVAPWGNIRLTSISDRTEELNLDGPKKLKRAHIYVCTYALNEAGIGDDGEVIPFIVRANYTYEKTVTKKNIDVQEETWV